MPIDYPNEQCLGLHLDGDTLYCAIASVKQEKITVKPVDTREIEELVKSHMVVTGTDVTLLIRPLQLPMVKEGAIDSALPLQMESLLPYPVEEGVIEKVILQKGEKETFLNTIAVKKEAIQQLLEKFQGLGVDPEVVSITPHALAHYVHYLKKDQEPRFSLYKGKSQLTLAASMGETLIGSFTTSDPQEIKKGILALRKRYPFPFREEVETVDDPNAIAIGYALSGLPNKSSLNLLKGDLAYKRPFRRLKKTLTLYFASIGLLTAAAYLFGQSYLTYQEDQLKEAFAEALYQRVDEEKEIAGLSLDELEEEIQGWQKKIQSTPNLFALHPNVPRVSDVLVFLAGYPELELLQFNYTLVKRPEMARKEEKYQVKVEIEFATETPRLAREFHDALIAPNEFVDPKGEIKWSTSRGSYKTSFYLKDKTFYP